jgi:hypothetical protein
MYVRGWSFRSMVDCPASDRSKTQGEDRGPSGDSLEEIPGQTESITAKVALDGMNSYAFKWGSFILATRRIHNIEQMTGLD